MAQRGRLIHQIHHVIIIGFHRKRKIIALHILLAHKIRKQQRLRIRIKAAQRTIYFPKLLHGTDSLLPHIAAIHDISVFIPLHLPAQLIAPAHHKVPDNKQLLQIVSISSFTRKVTVIEGVRMIEQGTI